MHPDYNPATFENDIAVVKFKKDVQFKEHIIPVSIFKTWVKIFGKE